MKRLRTVIYPSADEIDEIILERFVAVRRLPDGPRRQAALKEIAQLKMYAEAKRWNDTPDLKPGH